MIGYIFGLAVGGYIFVASAWALIQKIVRRRRYQRVPGVIIGRRDARGEQGMSPATHKRAAIFRFTTADGRVIETESDVQSFPGPKPGKRVTVIYDPRDPYDAETTGRLTIILILMPVVMAIGLAIVIAALMNLLA